MVPAAVRREWRQFRLLSRDSVRRLLASAVLSPDADPLQFAFWMTALAAVPPTLLAVYQLFPYSVPLPADALERLLLGDRTFFIVYGMTASALVAALMWEALFPDRLDHEVVGPLPVRPGTLAAARLTAALMVSLAFTTAVSVPSGLIFALISATHPLVGYAPQVIVAHVAATAAASTFAFLVLILLRGLVAASLGTAVADRLAIVLQLAAVTAIVQVLFHLPRVMPELVASLLQGDVLARTLPPLWFAALYAWMAGWDLATLAGPASTGVSALIILLAVVVSAYLAPARLMARRALESPSHHRARPFSGGLRRAIAAVVPPPAAAVTCFTLASLVRNRRHLLIAASHAGVALAIASSVVIAEAVRQNGAFGAPTVSLLSVPLVLLFLLVSGVRAACTPPTDLDANWLFRLRPPAVTHARIAMRLTLCLLAIVPVVALTALAALLAGWRATEIASVAAFNATAGVLLVEAALVGWSRVPFACPHAARPETVRSGWLIYAAPFLAFSFAGAALQLVALRSAAGTVLYVAAGLMAAAGIARWSERRMARSAPSFDPPPAHDAQVLDLSGARH